MCGCLSVSIAGLFIPWGDLNYVKAYNMVLNLIQGSSGGLLDYFLWLSTDRGRK